MNIDGLNLIMYDLLLGTVHGLILGPILYTIFLYPIFDIEQLFLFADDTFVPRINISHTELSINMKKSVKAMSNGKRIRIEGE